jgi:hypothetical protein
MSMAAPGAVLYPGQVDVAMLSGAAPPTPASAAIDPATEIDYEGVTDGWGQQEE